MGSRVPWSMCVPKANNLSACTNWFCKQHVPHVGRECWEQVVVFAHALVELAECIELCCGDLDNSRVPVPPPRKAVGLKAGDDFVDVKAAHAEAAPVARRGAEQLHP